MLFALAAMCKFYAMQPSEAKALTLDEWNGYMQYMDEYLKATSQSQQSSSGSTHTEQRMVNPNPRRMINLSSSS